MDLLLKLNERLNETKQELERSLKSEQGESTSQLPNVIPVISTVVPSTLAIALVPNVPMATAKAVTGAGTGRAPARTSYLSTEELIKSMEEIKLQVSELQKVKEKYVTLEQNYDLSKINFAEKVSENKGLEQRLKSLEKYLTFEKSLADIKNILWTNITQVVNDVWPSI